jgi:hypothetical protein
LIRNSSSLHWRNGNFFGWHKSLFVSIVLAKPMQLICPRCQTTNEREAHFCKICGTGFNVQPIRKNSISTPVIVIIAVVAVCGFCGLFGLINGSRTEIAKSTNSSITASPTTNSSEDSLPVRNIVEMPNSANTGEVKNSKSATVISENANLRETANATGEVIQIIPEDTKIEIIRQKGAWVFVSASGRTGWMHGNTIRLAESYSSESSKETVDNSSPPPPPPSTSLPKSKPKNSDGDSDDISNSSGYITGPRGGCYYINRNGNKTYVSREMCGGTDTNYQKNVSSSDGYIRGPRGGCYYVTSGGRKQYVDRSLCN